MIVRGSICTRSNRFFGVVFKFVFKAKRKSSYDLIRNCLIFRRWSHLGLNQGLPDYESGALTN